MRCDVDVPRAMECFDISNISGRHTSLHRMVCFGMAHQTRILIGAIARAPLKGRTICQQTVCPIGLFAIFAGGAR